MDEHFAATFERVPVQLQQRFDAMFTPNNTVFSGNLPTLATSDEKLRRVII